MVPAASRHYAFQHSANVCGRESHPRIPRATSTKTFIFKATFRTPDTFACKAGLRRHSELRQASVTPQADVSGVPFGLACGRPWTAFPALDVGWLHARRHSRSASSLRETALLALPVLACQRRRERKGGFAQQRSPVVEPSARALPRTPTDKLNEALNMNVLVFRPADDEAVPARRFGLIKCGIGALAQANQIIFRLHECHPETQCGGGIVGPR